MVFKVFYNRIRYDAKGYLTIDYLVNVCAYLAGDSR